MAPLPKRAHPESVLWRSGLLVLALVLGSLRGAAQGSLTFGNRIIGVLDAPVFAEDGQTPLAGSAFLAQLYVAAPGKSLAAVDVPVVFRSGNAAGYILAKVITLTGVPGGTRVTVEMRAWAAAAGGTYEEALANGGPAGVSPAFDVVCGGVPAPPADLLGLRSFSLRRPEQVRLVGGPSSRTLAVGTSLTWEVSAEGTAPISYQWFKNGQPLPGAVDRIFALAAVRLEDSGLYSVRASNAWSFDQSPDATLLVLVPPSLSRQPQSQTIRAGETAVLSVEAAGSAVLSYRWLHNGLELSGADQPTLTLPSFQAGAAGRYAVRVSNAVGAVDSDEALLQIAHGVAATAGTGGSVVWDPPAASSPEGTSVQFVATADTGFIFKRWTGTSESTQNPLTLRVESEVNLRAEFAPVNGTVVFLNRNLVAGVDAPVFDQDGLTRLEGRDYHAQLYGGTSVETLQPVGPVVWFGTGADAGYFESERDPIRAIPPVLPGEVAVVEVRAWAVADGASFEAARFSGGRAGRSAAIHVRTGGAGSPPAFPADLVGLETFTLDRAQPPTFEQELVGGVFVAGQEVQLAVAARGTVPLEYQWYKDLERVNGETSASLRFPAIGAADAGRYKVHVRNELGEIESAEVEVIVVVPPRIPNFQAQREVLFGGDLTLVVEPEGSAPFEFAWFAGESGRTESPVGNGTAALTLTGVESPGSYWVRVSNLAGAADSPTVSIEVLRHSQTIEFAGPSNQTYGDPPVRLVATASSGLPVSFALTAGPASLEGDLVTVTGSGLVELVASQAGNSRFLPAPPIARAFQVAKGVAVIQVTGLQQQYDGHPKRVTTATDPAGLQVLLTYDGETTPPTRIGTYQVEATIENSNYEGRATATLAVLGAIHGRVFHDRDLNGSPGPDEPGLKAATLRLYDALDQLLAQFITGDDGQYRFEGLRLGTYRLEEVNPEGFTSTTPDTVICRQESEGTLEVNFGDQNVPEPPDIALELPAAADPWAVEFAAEPGHTYTLQASQDLVTWTDVATDSARDGVIRLIDDQAGVLPWRFYRVRVD